MTDEIQATDRARELAQEHSVDLSELKGSGTDGRITADDVKAAIAEDQPDESATPDSWPTKGSSGPQPWEQDGNQEVGHSHPMLVSGSGGPEGAELAKLLAAAGYDTPIARGENPFSIVGAGELEAVRRFRDEFNVHEDPSGFGGDQALADAHVGPWTWEALERIAAAA